MISPRICSPCYTAIIYLFFLAYDRSTVEESHVPVGAGALQPHYPLGAPLYSCGGSEGGLSIREDADERDTDPEYGDVKFESGLQRFEDDVSEFGNGYMYDDEGLLYEDGDMGIEDVALRYKRELKGKGLTPEAAHPMLAVMQRLGALQVRP